MCVCVVCVYWCYGKLDQQVKDFPVYMNTVLKAMDPSLLHPEEQMFRQNGLSDLGWEMSQGERKFKPPDSMSWATT